MVISPKAYTATLNWKAVCGESRTHGLERAVEGQPSTATLRFTGLEDFLDRSGVPLHLQSFAPAERYVTRKINVLPQCIEDNPYEQATLSIVFIAFIT